MNRFYVITNRQKDPKLAVTGMLCDFLKSRGKECVLESEGPVPEGTDCVLVLGGDGTILQAARAYEKACGGFALSPMAERAEKKGGMKV